VPIASIGYQKHLLSLKVMTSPTEQELGPLWAVLSSTGVMGEKS